MQIDQSPLVMNSPSILKVEREDAAQLQFRAGERPRFVLPDELARQAVPPSPEIELETLSEDSRLVLEADKIELSAIGRHLADRLASARRDTAEPGEEVVYEVKCEDAIKIKLIRDFLAKLTGKQVELRAPRSFVLDREAAGLAEKLAEFYQLDQPDAPAAMTESAGNTEHLVNRLI